MGGVSIGQLSVGLIITAVSSSVNRSSANERKIVGDFGEYLTYVDYLASQDWSQRRNGALVRANHRCQVCNSQHNLQVHHRTYERVGHEDPADLTVLCQNCHNLFHKRSSTKPSRRPTPQTSADLERLKTVLNQLTPGTKYTTRDIAAYARTAPSSVGNHLIELAQLGIVKRAGKKRWAIPDSITEPKFEAFTLRAAASPAPASGRLKRERFVPRHIREKRDWHKRQRPLKKPSS